MIWLLFIIAALIAFWFYQKSLPQLNRKQKFPLIFLRTIAFFILIILLFNPILRFQETKKIKPRAIFLTDTSQSMDLIEQAQSKREFFLPLQDKISRLLKNNYQIDHYNFAADLAGDSTATLLSPTLRTLLQQQKPTEISEIFLLSDGWFQDENLQILEKLNLPINCLLPEIPRKDSDLAIHSLEKNETAFIDDLSPLKVNLRARKYQGKAQLTLRYAEKELTRTIDFSNGEFQEIMFDLEFSESGLQKISAEIEAADLLEQNLDNNRYQTAIKVEKQRRKILIISDQLNWDIHFLMRALRSDSKYEPILLTKHNKLSKAQQEIQLAAEMNSIDLLILSNFGNLKFSEAELALITNYHKSNGSLLFWGEYAEQFSQLLPSQPTTIRSQFSATFSLTEKAREYATFDFDTKAVPPLKYRYLRPKAEAKVLATFDNAERSPFILLAGINSKILHLAGQKLWRWQMQTENFEFNTFINNLVNWLSTRSVDNFISFPDKSSYQSGEKVEIELIAYDEKLQKINDLNAKILLKSLDEVIDERYLTQQAGNYSVSYENLPEGNYSYEIIDDKSKNSSRGEFMILPGGRESRDFGINKTMLNYVANLTSGKIITAENLAEHDFSAQPKTLIQHREIPLYKKIWLIITFLAAFSLELFLRKRWGLL